jgi:hypothetical protein
MERSASKSKESSWIVSPRYDLTFFILSTLSSYLILYLHFGLGVSALLLWWIWIVFFDGPHIFATLTRTYFDREEWRVRGRLLKWSLLIFAIPIVVVVADDLTQTETFLAIFVLVFTLYQWWHIVRQHYGFMVLYQKRNGEPSGRGNSVDFWFFHLIMYVPYFSIVAQNETVSNNLPFLAGNLIVMSSLPMTLNVASFVLVAGYICYTAYLWSKGKVVNKPKLLLLSAVIPLPLIVSMSSLASIAPYILLAAATTIYHNIQYQGIVWYYAGNRYRRKQKEQEKKVDFGLATKLTRSFLGYYLAAILFTIIYRYTLWGSSDSLNLPFVFKLKEFFDFSGGEAIKELAAMFAMAIALHHFYLDQKIWKVSSDKRLQDNLKQGS